MKRLPDAIFIADVEHNHLAVDEAIHLDIPIFAIVDTNTDPTKIDYPIPANDDSIRTVQLVADSFSQTIQQSKRNSE